MVARDRIAMLVASPIGNRRAGSRLDLVVAWGAHDHEIQRLEADRGILVDRQFMMDMHRAWLRINLAASLASVASRVPGEAARLFPPIGRVEPGL
jgi:hypothetical protein